MRDKRYRITGDMIFTCQKIESLKVKRAEEIIKG